MTEQTGGIHNPGTIMTAGGPVVGGNYTSNHFGVSEEKVVSWLDAILAAVHVEKSVPLVVLQQILAGFGELDVLLEPAYIEHRLRTKVDEYQALLQRLERLSNDDPDVVRLRREAGGLLGVGRFDDADAMLARAERLDLEVVEELEALIKCSGAQ